MMDSPVMHLIGAHTIGRSVMYLIGAHTMGSSARAEDRV